MNPKAITENRRTILSTLWIFVTLNYLYCDVITLMSPEFLNALLTGETGGINMDETTLLAAAIIMEIPIAMVLLSRVLNYKVNRLMNIIAGLITTLVMIATLLMETPSYHYLFFATIEIATTLFIVWYAWKWVEPSSSAK